MWVATRRNIPVAVMPWPERPGRVTAIAKLSFDLDAAGNAVRAARPDPLTPDTLGVGGMLLFPSDFVREKQRCDVVVVGRALTLPPAPTHLRVGSVTKRELHVATLGPVLVRASAATVQHAPADQQLERVELPLRLSYRRAELALELSLPGPAPVMAVGRAGRVLTQRATIDTIAIDPARARVMICVRAVIDGLDVDGGAMLIVDEDAAPPTDTSELVSFRVSEVVPTVAESDRAARRERPTFDDLDNDETSVDIPARMFGEIAGRAAPVDETVSIEGDPLELEDPLSRTVRAAPLTVVMPPLAPPAGAPYRPPSATLPMVPGRASRAALPFARPGAAPAGPAAVPPIPAAAPAPEPVDDEQTEVPVDTTQAVPAGLLASPVLPFARRASPMPGGALLEETTADVDSPLGGGGEAPARSTTSPRPALPFPAAASGARPIPAGLQPATPFERKSVPPVAGTPLPTPVAPLPAPGPPPALVAPAALGVPARRFNVGFDLKPIAPREAEPERARPTLSFEQLAKVRAELWARPGSRREVLRSHGLTEIQWRLAERSLIAVAEDKTKGAAADRGQALLALVEGLSAAVREVERGADRASSSSWRP